MARHSLLIVKDNKFSEDIELFFCKLATGRPIKCACGIAKVNYSTIKTWINEGRKLIEEDRESYTESENNLMLFSTRYEQASAIYEDKLLSLIDQYTNNDEKDKKSPVKAQFVLSLLKSRFPENYCEARISIKDNFVENSNVPKIINVAVPSDGFFKQ